MISFSIPVWASKTYPVKRVAEQTFIAFQTFYVEENGYKQVSGGHVWKPKYIRIGDASKPMYQKDLGRYVRFSDNTFIAYTSYDQACRSALDYINFGLPAVVKPVEIVKGSTYYVNDNGIVTASHMRLVNSSDFPSIPELSLYEYCKGIFLNFIDWLFGE